MVSIIIIILDWTGLNLHLLTDNITLFKKNKEVPPARRYELFIRKLAQCQILFDFNDPSSDLKNKEIKRSALQEILEYISSTRGVINDTTYINITRMVKLILSLIG